MKRKLFIGSSREGVNIARQIKSAIDAECFDWLDVQIWDEGKIFARNKSALDSLFKASRRYEYGILIATSDDLTLSRFRLKASPRDNIVFEIGLFLGSLGLERAYMLLEKKSKTPSDFYGINVPTFNRKDKAGLEDTINKLVDSIKETRNRFSIKPIPSTALAIGYFNNFILPLAKRKAELKQDFNLKVLLPDYIHDVYTERNVYLKNNPSITQHVFDDGQRPTVYQYDGKPNQFWDVPTTLSTLYKLIEMISPTNEIGIDIDKQEWIRHEIINFGGTVLALIQNSSACRDSVTVEQLN